MRDDGTISREEFERGAKSLLHSFDHVLDVDWVEEANACAASSAARGYARVLNDVRASDDDDDARDEGSDDADDHASDDDPAAVAPERRTGHVREYRIVYSASFRAPVLCVRARDGGTRQPWTISRVLERVSCERASHISASPFDRDPVLTPYENPHERSEGGWACVHPCATADVMRLLLAHPRERANDGDDDGRQDDDDVERYFAIWIRVVAREIGLRLAVAR